MTGLLADNLSNIMLGFGLGHMLAMAHIAVNQRSGWAPDVQRRGMAYVWIALVLGTAGIVYFIVMAVLALRQL